jgi:hypothetical protein
MSWLFSQALVEEYSGASCLDGEPCVQLNVKPTHQQFWRNDKMMDCSNLSQFGQTLQLLTESRGEELLMSFLADFPVRTSAQQERVQASMVSVPDCGERWCASFAKYDQDSVSWKTHQHLLLGGLEEFSETWPRWGTMLNGECWERTTLELLTNVTGSGLWQTPVADDAVNRKVGKWNSRGEPKLSAQVLTWPTPTVCGNHQAPKPGTSRGTGLSTAVKRWPTPTVQDSQQAGGKGCIDR